MIGDNWQFTLHITPLLVAGVVSILLGLYAWRRRGTTGTTPFALLTLAVAIWSLGYALEIGSTEKSVKVFWAKVQYFGITGAPLAWLAFALQFTNREKWLTRRNIALFTFIPLLTIPIVWTTELHGLLWSGMTITPWRHEGTGLGLSIVKHLTQLMGGQITVNSQLGRGTTFTATFPFDPSAANVNSM